MLYGANLLDGRTRPHLSIKSIEAAKQTVCDGNWLFLQVTKAGLKSWLFKYKLPGARAQSSIKLGNYPDMLPDDARRLRDKAKAMVEIGVDPRDHIKTEYEITDAMRNPPKDYIKILLRTNLMMG